MSEKQERVSIGVASTPSLQPHTRLRHDAARNRWVILAPERVFTPDPIAVAVLRLCDGMRTVDAIAGELEQAYQADKNQILTDIISMLQDLTDKGVLKA